VEVDLDVEAGFVPQPKTCVAPAAVPMDLVKIGRKTLRCGVKGTAVACCCEARYKGRNNMVPNTTQRLSGIVYLFNLYRNK
jgi:hypothetical protein